MSRTFNPGGSSSYGFNPYYHPARCGLEILGVLEDPHANYSFDTVVVWIDLATSDLYAAHDSGCSCPSPFEGYHSTGDLTPVRSWQDVDGVIGQSYTTYDSADVFRLRRSVESYLDGMQLATRAVEDFREKLLSPQIAFCDPEVGPLADLRKELGSANARIADLETSLADACTERDTAYELNSQYLQIVREQGEFIESIKKAIAAFRARENGGRFS